MQLRDYQRECIEKIVSLQFGSYLVQMATGLGKCFARGTKILMFDGSLKEVQNIVPGDLVMGWDSKPRIVKSCAKGKEKMYEIKRKKHESYIVNESHILSLKITGISNSRNRSVCDSTGRKFKSGDICNIEVKDYIKCSKTFKHVAKGFCVPVDFKSQAVPVDPYFLGLWLGDGNSRCLKITTEDHEIVTYLKSFCKSNGFILETLKDSNSGNAKDYFLKDYKHNRVRKYFRENLFLNKHIPKEYIINSRRVRLQILAGLLDTDGHCIDGSIFEFCSKHESFRDQVAFLCRTLGFTARCFKRHNNLYDKDFYYCIISGNTSEIPTKIQRKKAKANPNKNNLMHGIEVIPIGEDEYFGFEISGNDRMFLLWDCTVVHNTVTFANIPRKGRVLLLSHRDELVHQPVKYYDCPVGIECATERSNGEEVVSASVQSLVRRLDRFKPDDFDMIITDEAHRSPAMTYRKIYDYFKPRLHLGFTATPNRSDGVRLDDIYQDIIFQRDLKWAIKNGYLSDIRCLRANIGYDLSKVSRRMGDFAPGELEKAMNIEGQNDAIAQVYREQAVGQTLIFAVSVAHAKAIAEKIPGAVVVDAKTKNRAEIIERFTRREIPVLVNCMIFTEGTDMPLIETIIMARPTTSNALYTQMVGRGLRLSPGKDKLTLIDCVGVTGTRSLCSAPSLIGVDISNLPPKLQNEVQGDLFDLPEIAELKADNPTSWIRNIEIVDLWAKDEEIDLHDVNWFKMPSGDLVLSLPGGKLKIPAPDALGETVWNGQKMKIQNAVNSAYRYLVDWHPQSRYIWDLKQAKKWGKSPASDKQKELVKRKCKNADIDIESLTKLQASQILNRIFGDRK